MATTLQQHLRDGLGAPRNYSELHRVPRVLYGLLELPEFDMRTESVSGERAVAFSIPLLEGVF